MIKRGHKSISVILGNTTFNKVLALAQTEHRSITSTVERIVLIHFTTRPDPSTEIAGIDEAQAKRGYLSSKTVRPLLDGLAGNASPYLRRVIEQIVKATVADAIAEAKIAQYRASAVTDSRTE